VPAKAARAKRPIPARALREAADVGLRRPGVSGRAHRVPSGVWPRPRRRLGLAEDPVRLHARSEPLRFLYQRQAPPAADPSTRPGNEIL
jgi:hypothetical protein